jgi:hypothetical protein
MVLEKDRGYRSSYEDYNRDRSQVGIFGRRMNRSALPPKERILGVRLGGQATAFVVSDLRDAGIVEGEVGDVPIMLAAVDDDLPIVAFERAVGDRVLTFAPADSPEPTLEDAETHSRWRLSDGEAIDGPLRGQRLTRVTAHSAFWFGWYSFFPYSTIWQLFR